MIWCSKPRGFVHSRIKRLYAFHGPFNLTGLKGCVCVCVCSYLCIFIYIYICVYLHICTCLCICLCLCLCICAYLCVFMYVFMFVCVCVCVMLGIFLPQRKSTFTSLALLCPLCLSWFVLYSFSTPFMSFLPDESRLDWQPVAMRPW